MNYWIWIVSRLRLRKKYSSFNTYKSTSIYIPNIKNAKKTKNIYMYLCMAFVFLPHRIGGLVHPHKKSAVWWRKSLQKIAFWAHCDLLTLEGITINNWLYDCWKSHWDSGVNLIKNSKSFRRKKVVGFNGLILVLIIDFFYNVIIYGSIDYMISCKILIGWWCKILCVQA